MSIDERLKEIQLEIGCCRYHMESKEFRDSIKQAFTDEGYRKCAEVMGGVHGHILESDGKSHYIKPDVAKKASNL